MSGLLRPARSNGRYRLYTPELLHGLKRIKYLRDVKQLNLPWFESTLGHRWYNPSSEEAVNEPQPARLVIVSDPENVVGRAPIDV